MVDIFYPKKCPRCGKVIDRDFRETICPYCGRPIKVKKHEAQFRNA